jgi:hypothetical protein
MRLRHGSRARSSVGRPRSGRGGADPGARHPTGCHPAARRLRVLAGEAISVLDRVHDLSGRGDGDARAGSEVDELAFRLVVMRRTIADLGDSTDLGPAELRDLLVARRALAEALGIVADVLRRLDPG